MVRFEVETKSISHEDLKFSNGGSCSFDENARPQYINRKGMTKLFFTYSVEWKQSDVRWASRWDSYLAMSDVQIHWFSIVNSVIVVFFLSGILTMIIIRTLRRDIAKYISKLFETFELFLILFSTTGTIRTKVMTKRLKNLDGNLFTEMFSVRRNILNFLPLLSGAEFRYFAWESSLYVYSIALRLFCFFTNLFIFSFCHAGNALARIQRRPYDSRYFPLCLHGADCRLPFGPTLQDHERKRVEEGRLPCMFVNL